MISHLNKNNKPNIVDITKKKITKRSALAQGVIKFSKVIFKKKTFKKTFKKTYLKILFAEFSKRR